MYACVWQSGTICGRLPLQFIDPWIHTAFIWLASTCSVRMQSTMPGGCATHSAARRLVDLYSLDGAVLAGKTGPEAAAWIYRNNLKLINGADIVIVS